MAAPTPQHRDDADGGQDLRPQTGRPRWVTAVLIAAVLLLALVVVLHLTGNSLGGPGSHMP
ncbi:hypothetical protein [Blastococcus sp. TF02A-35]|uniref:hypothetical protein n=1 Tax=Blastococcus sp. TF02A-35 TaxID=2559612 RepID=UPI0010730371|nr:hypothetical protein [Blastococcus sp. TF02A_35]TFV43753.1 hypothetical protein E4P43_19515 [Blastococcus sp. TF02A_35]